MCASGDFVLNLCLLKSADCSLCVGDFHFAAEVLKRSRLDIKTQRCVTATTEQKSLNL
jgi:hypothetical protein